MAEDGMRVDMESVYVDFLEAIHQQVPSSHAAALNFKFRRAEKTMHATLIFSGGDFKSLREIPSPAWLQPHKVKMVCHLCQVITEQN